MKEYFKRNNVIIVLGILFSGISYAGFKVIDIISKTNSEHKIHVNERELSDIEKSNSLLVDEFIIDSLSNISERIKEYRLFIIKARKYPHYSNINKAFMLKRIVYYDIARLSKFEGLKLSDQLPNEYLIISEYLSGEKKMVDLIHKFSLAVEAKSYKSSVEIYGEMENAFLELILLQNKNISKRRFAYERLSQQKENSLKQIEKFNYESQNNYNLFMAYMIFGLFCITSWITVFLFAIIFGTFKE